MALLYIVLAVFIPAFIVAANVYAAIEYKDKDKRDHDLKLHQVNVQAVQADTMRFKERAPALVGAIDAFNETNRKLHTSSLTSVTPARVLLEANAAPAPAVVPSVTPSQVRKVSSGVSFEANLAQALARVPAPILTVPVPVASAVPAPEFNTLAQVQAVAPDSDIRIRFSQSAEVVIGRYSDFDLHHAVLVVDGIEEHIATYDPSQGLSEDQIVQQACLLARSALASRQAAAVTSSSNQVDVAA